MLPNVAPYSFDLQGNECTLSRNPVLEFYNFQNYLENVKAQQGINT